MRRTVGGTAGWQRAVTSPPPPPGTPCLAAMMISFSKIVLLRVLQRLCVCVFPLVIVPSLTPKHGSVPAATSQAKQGVCGGGIPPSTVGMLFATVTWEVNRCLCVTAL